MEAPREASRGRNGKGHRLGDGCYGGNTGIERVCSPGPPESPERPGVAGPLEPMRNVAGKLNRELGSLPGQQLVVVRYGEGHNPMNEWVYNDPDIDHSKVVWAHEMKPSSNQELLEYYRDRKAWLVQPDGHPISIDPYPCLSRLP